jgi:hypothetical protein
MVSGAEPQFVVPFTAEMVSGPIFSSRKYA